MKPLEPHSSLLSWLMVGKGLGWRALTGESQRRRKTGQAPGTPAAIQSFAVLRLDAQDPAALVSCWPLPDRKEKCLYTVFRKKASLCPHSNPSTSCDPQQPLRQLRPHSTQRPRTSHLSVWLTMVHASETVDGTLRGSRANESPS